LHKKAEEVKESGDKPWNIWSVSNSGALKGHVFIVSDRTDNNQFG